MSKGNSLNRKEPVIEGILEYQEGRKNMTFPGFGVCKQNIGKYSKLSISSLVC